MPVVVIFKCTKWLLRSHCNFLLASRIVSCGIAVAIAFNLWLRSNIPDERCIDLASAIAFILTYYWPMAISLLAYVLLLDN